MNGDCIFHQFSHTKNVSKSFHKKTFDIFSRHFMPWCLPIKYYAITTTTTTSCSHRINYALYYIFLKKYGPNKVDLVLRWFNVGRAVSRRRMWGRGGSEQCDQIGRFFALWATFQSLWQQLIGPNLPHSKAIFVKVSKSISFLMKSFLGNFYRHFTIFSGHTGSEVVSVPSYIHSCQPIITLIVCT